MDSTVESNLVTDSCVIGKCAELPKVSCFGFVVVTSVQRLARDMRSTWGREESASWGVM